MFRSASLFIGTSFTVAVFTIFATSNVDSIVGIPHKIYSMQRILIHIKSRSLCYMCPSAPRVCSEPGGQKPVLSLSLDRIRGHVYSIATTDWPVDNRLKLCSGCWLTLSFISMAKYKIAVTPLLTHWSYCSLALTHRSNPIGRYQSFIIMDMVHVDLAAVLKTESRHDAIFVVTSDTGVFQTTLNESKFASWQLSLSMLGRTKQTLISPNPI